MRHFVTVGIAALAVGAATLAATAESRGIFPNTLERVTSEKIRAELEGMGYRVDRIEVEHDCYEVRAVNQSGLPIKAKYDLKTGELIRAKLR